MEPFKAIDMNKDKQIDLADLRLFLDYLDKLYTSN
jgi:hypothetical protein